MRRERTAPPRLIRMPAPRPTYERAHPRPPRSVGIAAVLALLLGPLGLFYVSVPVAVLMLFLTVFGAVFTMLLSLPVTWAACVVIAVVLARMDRRAREAPPPHGS